MTAGSTWVEDPDSPPDSAPPCLNCGTTAPGNFCPDCGQETARASPSFGEWLRGSMAVALNQRGRLWLTLSAVLFAPGLLTAEYRAGRKARYLRPLQVDLTASLVVFAAVQLFGLGRGLLVLASYAGIFFVANVSLLMGLMLF